MGARKGGRGGLGGFEGRVGGKGEGSDLKLERQGDVAGGMSGFLGGRGGVSKV